MRGPRWQPSRQAAPVQAAQEGATLDPRIIAASVRVMRYVGQNAEDKPMYASGSGVIIDFDAAQGRAIVITNRHIFTEEKFHAGAIITMAASTPRGLVVATQEGTVLHGFRIAIAAANEPDLAAIVVTVPQGQRVGWIRLASRSPVRGEKCYQAGYPIPQGAHQGRIPLVRRIAYGLGRQGGHTILSPFARGGDSGSGIFLAAAQGEPLLAAVLWGGLREATYAVPVEDLNKFIDTKCCRWLKRKRQNQTPVQPTDPVPPVDPRPPVEPPLPPPDVPTPPPAVDLSGILARIAALEARPSLPGPVGPQGPEGPRGADGVSVRGDKGDAGRPGRDGKNGQNGRDGKAGADGKDADITAIMAALDQLKKQLGQKPLTGSIRFYVPNKK